MTYICPFCKRIMIHQPKNKRETTDITLVAKIGDTFKCECSIREKDSDNSICRLNSWKLEEDGWYHLGHGQIQRYKEKENVWEKIEFEIPYFDFNPSRRW